MREIISIQIGQAGNQVGHQFWSTVSKEHSIDRQGHFNGADDKQLKRLSVYYNESSTGRFVPRTLLCDMEPGTLNFIRTSTWGSLYHPNGFVFGRTGAGNNWAKGYYGEGAQLVSAIQDQVRNNVEACGSMQGINTLHACGGGTGSGTSSALWEHLIAEYSGTIHTAYTIYPSPKVSDVVVEPYNTILVQNHLINEINLGVAIDNEALYNVCYDTLEIFNTAYEDLNRLCALVMSGVTSSLRFSGQSNLCMRKLLVNLVPSTRLHFLCPSFAPLCTKSVENYRQFSVADLTTQIFDANNLMVAIDPRAGMFLTASCVYRGDVPTQQIDEETLRIQTQYSNNFVNWIPHNIKTSSVDVPHDGFTSSATMLCNTTAITGMLRRITGQFEKMFKKSAFLHWYTACGMEEQEFLEAKANMADLAAGYEDAGVGDPVDAE